MNNKFRNLILLVFALVIAAPWALSLLLDGLSKAGFKKLEQELLRSGVYSSGIRFEKVYFRSWNRIEWKGASFAFILKKGAGGAAGKINEVNAVKFFLELRKPYFGHLCAGIENAVFAVLAKGTAGPGELLKIESAEMEFPAALNDPIQLRAQIAVLLRDLYQFLTEGKAVHSIRLSAVSSFTVSGQKMQVRLGAERFSNESVLVMSKKDLKEISIKLSEKLSVKEIELLSLNPLRAPKLLQIRDEAVLSSKNLAARVQDFPEDAYRHVYWSYLLTQEYGEAFAERVTNAHEAGSENSEAERKMDLNNNQLGRLYAVRGYSSADLPARFIEDLKVIREPESGKASALKEEKSQQPQDRLPGLPANRLEVIEENIQGEEGRIQARIS